MTYDLLGFFSSLIVLFTVYCHFVCTYFPVNFNVLCLYCILLSFLQCFIVLYCIAALLCENKVYNYSAIYMSQTRDVTSSALQSRKWQLIGMSQWCRSALCGPVRANGQLDPRCS